MPEKKPDAVQKAEAKPPEQKVDDKKPVQKDGAVGGGPGASGGGNMAAAASQAIASKGTGQALNPSTRGQLESGLGVDLGHVRVHDDARARQAADDLNARAFTHGSDIWLGEGASQQDTHLMAHEATHVVQQAGGVRRMIQRKSPSASSAGEGSWDYDGKEGKVRKGKRLVIPKMKVPTFKKKLTTAPFDLPKKSDDPRPDTQREEWDKAVRAGSGIDSKLDKKLKAEQAPSMTKGGEPINFLKLKNQEFYIFGNRAAIKNRLLRPTWDRDGKWNFFQVDHKQELQLGGGEGVDNLWLLDAAANMSSGRNIRAEKNQRIQKLLDASQKVWSKPPDIETIRKSYTITVESVEGGLPVDGKPATNWSLEEIRDQAEQVDSLKAMTKKEIEAKGLQGTPDKLVIYTNEAGGGVREVDWKEGDTAKNVNFLFGKLFKVNKVSYNQKTKKGFLHGNAFKDNKVLAEVHPKFPIEESEAVEYGGYVPSGAVTHELQSLLKAKGLSPIKITQAELTDRGFVARGQIISTLPLLKDLQLDLSIDGNDIYVSKVLGAADFKFPGPIAVTGASVEIFAGTPGLGVRGDVFFEIDRVGKGKLTGKGSTGRGIEIGGEFDFDTQLFNPAKVHVQYADGKFSGGGEIGIQAGKVKGIKSAHITAHFDDELITATGAVKPDLPGIEQGDMTMSYGKETGLVIGGTLQLKKDLPGISSGSVSAQVTKKPGEERYIVKASGTATPKIPGISSQLTVSYDDGTFDASVTAGYEKGRLKGSLTAGATNRPVDDKGKPAGGAAGEKADKIVFYGGGSLSLKLAPWLQATAGVMFKPNGEIQISGEIGLPEALNIFPEKKLDKNIFKIGIDIPIVGVSVAGQRIGIFANITGGLDLSAGIGPGQLQALKLKVDYNPDHEDQTHVQGDAKLHVPAHAGLRMFVRGGLGVGIPIVSAQAGIEVGGQLGLEGALDTGVHVDWSPAKGLALDANAEVYVEPKLKFDVTGFVLVEADLLLTTIELYNKRWQLAGFEYGSGLCFGVSFPVHYEEGKELNLSLDNVKFQVPDIRPKEMLSDLIKKIA